MQVARARRAYTAAEREAIAQGAEALGLSLDQALDCIGEETRDVVLNGVAFWSNVPARVWDYHIGGYQVIKKWLSYRERKLLGRGLRPEEAKYVTEMVRRLAALRLLEPALDANYETVKSDTYPFPSQAESDPSSWGMPIRGSESSSSPNRAAGAHYNAESRVRPTR